MRGSKWRGRRDGARLRGFVSAIPYRNVEIGFVVARVVPGATAPVEVPRRQVAAAVGTMPDLQADVVLDAEGRWRRHPRHGREFVVDGAAYHVEVAGTEPQPER